MKKLKKNELSAKKHFWMNDMEAIFVIMMILIIIGMVNVFSASFVTAEMTFKNPYFFLVRHLISIGVGALLFIVAANFNYHKLRTFVPVLMVFTLAALVFVLFMGTSVNGARRWVGLGSMQFQPSEIAKIVCIIMTASFLGGKIDKHRTISLFNRTFLIVLLMAAAVEFEPDMGTAVLIGGIPVLMHFIAGMKTKWISYALLVVGVLFGLLITFQSYRIDRIKSWYDPWSQSQGFGYQTVQSLSAIGSGGLFGMGLGKGISKYSYLPEAHTDFAFAVFSQENGLIAVLFVFFLYAALAVYCGKIAKRAYDGFGKMLACGIMLLIVGQAAANLYMVVGLLPVVGVPLPFISYGGTSLILNMVSIGILINIGRYAKKANKKAYNNSLERSKASTTERRRMIHRLK
ncbi:FtsW/RodA/SpoVE family cell cycle protein [Pectinatus sottacetonis]|uniref:FtsW/RodA/SpoVE family cell cycle protein n=1 Tax=Pectinatus sottacetonis TaxID=1002795 RepID=UPI001E486E66|nr:putative peptidoglycan glycosyltransferase FtsW [Pectinatus sottacetonis]